MWVTLTGSVYDWPKVAQQHPQQSEYLNLDPPSPVYQNMNI